MRKLLLLTAAVGLGIGGYALYYRRSQILAQLLNMPAPTNRVTTEYSLAMPMPDGITLYADHFFPCEPGDYPTVLIRTPYGRPGERPFLGFLAPLAYLAIAERGYHVVVQSVRGRFSSEGVFEPFVNEAVDGRVTMEWIARQPWFNGSLGLWGASYVGYTQWSLAAEAPPFLKALVPAITSTRFSRLFYPAEGVFTFESSLNWVYLIHMTAGSRLDMKRFFQLMPNRLEAKLQPARQHQPISESDQIATGRSIDFYQTWLKHYRYQGAYWRQVDLQHTLGNVHAPAHLIAGWYDIFLREQLADYAVLVAAGRNPYLTIGPQHHTETSLQIDTLRESLHWYATHLKGVNASLRKRAVRIYLMGAHEWHEMDYWPPPGRMTRYYLQKGRRLSDKLPVEAFPPERYTYRPADPTPNLGGAILISQQAGAQDQRSLEQRTDLLVYTGPQLDHDLDVIGHVWLELYVKPGVAYCDFVGRLCDVYPDGRSVNICDGIIRLEAGTGELQADGSRRIEIDMVATAQRFRAGHRLRLHIASAGHPRWSINVGTGETFGIANPDLAIQQIIYQDIDHPSALVLPVVTAAERKRFAGMMGFEQPA